MNTALAIPRDHTPGDRKARRGGLLPLSADTMQRIVNEEAKSRWSGDMARSHQNAAASLVPLKKMVHELRDPLTLILLTAERALRGTQDRAVTGALGLIRDETRRAEHIMQGTLERAIGETENKPIGALNTVVRRALAEAKRYCDACAPDRLAWELDLTEPSPEVRMNSFAIGQVIVNLIKNAVEASKGNLHAIVRTANTPELAEVVVSDNCGGIPDEALPRIFEPFVTTKREAIGRGLGLSICNEIVTDHGGQLLVATEVGRGSVFTIRLPRARAALDCQ